MTQVVGRVRLCSHCYNVVIKKNDVKLLRLCCDSYRLLFSAGLRYRWSECGGFDASVHRMTNAGDGAQPQQPADEDPRCLCSLLSLTGSQPPRAHPHPPTCVPPHLCAVVGDGGEDGAQGLDAHGDVEQVAGEEEVVVVSQQGHDEVPAQVQEGLLTGGAGRQTQSRGPHTDKGISVPCCVTLIKR